MSTITRAFTTRRVKMSTDIAASRDAPQRSNTTKGAGYPSIRNKISAPLELIHTTNMLSYNAPDILPQKQVTSPSSDSSRSDDESDSSPTTAASSPPTSPEVSPAERSMSPEPNHLSCYFTPPGQALTTPGAGVVEAPIIPRRAPSHTKKASYEALARSRSNSALNSRYSNTSGRTLSTKASFSFSTGSRVSSTSTNASSVSHAPSLSFSQKPSVPPTPAVYQPTTTQQQQPRQEAPPESHPFGHELAQVSEIAEEYGVTEKLNALDEEEQELRKKGLKKFSAEDYLSEVQALINSFFYDAPPVRHARPVAAVWI